MWNYENRNAVTVYGEVLIVGRLLLFIVDPLEAADLLLFVKKIPGLSFPVIYFCVCISIKGFNESIPQFDGQGYLLLYCAYMSSSKSGRMLWSFTKKTLYCMGKDNGEKNL